MRPPYRIQEMKRSGEWNETLRRCVLLEHRGCESNAMVRFFCGPQRFCATGSRRALRQAKYNIRNFYSVVGLQEKLQSFLRVSAVVLPDFFGTGRASLGHEKRNRDTYFERVEARDKELIRKRNKADVELYEFVKKRFRILMKSCKHKGM